MNSLLTLLLTTGLAPTPTIVWTVSVTDLATDKVKTYAPGPDSLPIPVGLKDVYCTVSKTVIDNVENAEMFSKILKCHSGDFMSQIAASCIKIKNEKESFNNIMYILNKSKGYSINLECE